jgi:hypothetical protein
MLYRSFIDDSADEKQEDVVTAGAVVAAHGEWEKIRRAWNKRLRADGLTYFRSTDYYSLSEQFSRYRDPIKYPKPKGSEAAKALRDDLETILKESPAIAIGVAIPVKLYRDFLATNPGADGKFGEDIFYSALQTLFIECARTVRDELPLGKNGKENKIAFICDDTSRAPIYSGAYANFKARNPKLAEMMLGLLHRDDKLTPPLQAADMMASLTKELALPCLIDAVQMKKPLLVSSGSEAPRLKDTVYKIVIWDHEWMERLLAAQHFGAAYSDILSRL